MKSSPFEIFQVCFRLGWIAFGGPAAHIALMRDELVEKQKWLSEQTFLDLIGLTNLIPGPNSTEMVLHCGRERGGVPGLFAAGLGFLSPAIFLSGLLAFLYVKYGELPSFQPLLVGLGPAVFIFILGAFLKLWKKAIVNPFLLALGVLTMLISLFGASEIVALLFGGLTYVLLQIQRKELTVFAPVTIFLTQATANDMDWTTLFLKFLKIGALLYGSGYVLFAFAETELVESGWLSQAALIEAIGIGQVTPGPVLSTSTFIGYQIGGFTGAILASLGIFLPSFLYVLFLGPYLVKWSSIRGVRTFLNGVNAAAVALIGVVVIDMGKHFSTDLFPWITCAVLALFYFGFKKTNPFLILGVSILCSFLNGTFFA